MLLRASPWQSAQDLPAAPALRVPQRLAVEHPQHAGIGGVVVLHRAGLARHEVVAGVALGERDVGGEHGSVAARTRRQPRATASARTAMRNRPGDACSFDRDLGRLGRREAVVAGPGERDGAALGRDRGERDERIGGDRGIELGAEDLLAVIGADEVGDDVARDRARRCCRGGSRSPSRARSAS